MAATVGPSAPRVVYIHTPLSNRAELLQLFDMTR